MNTLEFRKFRIMGANIGEESCLPDMKNDEYIRAPISVDDSVSAEERWYIGQGMITTLLPYQIQNGYDRTRSEKYLDAAILENDSLRATFVPELGGRLWSLYDKKADRELLYANDVFQPGNLALRNAWFSGGVEWNIGIKGHNPLTCSVLFAQEVTSSDGAPMLRMYEFERIREVVYSITAKLQDEVLLVKITIENTSDQDKFMYWWSNIAVDETEKTRVIVPAREAFWCAYEEGAYRLGNADIPYNVGKDVSYPTNLKRARDFFYKIPEEEKKWITAIDGDGYGLVHISTALLHGRKLFAWGQAAGGRHWNEWLSDSGKRYIEIQAGLMKTQLEHFIMPGKSEISWTEGYSMVHADRTFAHGADYDAAISEIKRRIADKQRVVETCSFHSANAQKPVYLGSGWGALENMIREKAVSQTLVFPRESIGEREADWLILLEEGKFPVPQPNAPIKSYVKGRFWIDKLQTAEDSWYKFYQLGVLYYEEKDVNAAYAAFEKSIVLLPNPWAYRNLAQLEKNEYHDLEKAVAYMEKSVAQKKDYPPLWINYAEALIAAGNNEKWVQVYEQLPDKLKGNGRLRMMYTLCLEKTGRPYDALKILNDHFEMPDIREGEFAISHIWLDIHRAIMKESGITDLGEETVYRMYPLPYSLDFRMH